MYVSTTCFQSDVDRAFVNVFADGPVIAFEITVKGPSGSRQDSRTRLRYEPANIRAFAESLAEATAKLNAIAEQLEADATAEKGAAT